MKKILVYLTLIILVILSTGCANTREADQKQRIEIENSKAVLGTLVTTLTKFYNKNLLKAEQLFENKIIIAGGRISSVGKFNDRPDILYIKFERYNGILVIAQIRDSYRKDLERYGQGDAVFVKGLCSFNKDKQEICLDGARLATLDEVAEVPSDFK